MNSILNLEFVSSSKLIGSGLATIGVAGSAIGIGTISGASIIAAGRNPSLKDQLFPLAMLGSALTEATALSAPMTAPTTLSS